MWFRYKLKKKKKKKQTNKNKKKKKANKQKTQEFANKEKKVISQIPKQGPVNTVTPTDHCFRSPALQAAFQLKIGRKYMHEIK